MADEQQTSIQVSSDISSQDIISSIDNGFRFFSESVIRCNRVYYDSFDWRLYRKGYLLFIENLTWKLCNRDDGEIKTFLHISLKNKKPQFWWDFAESTLSRELKSILDMRALMPLLSLTSETQTLRILNKDEKTVAFVDLRYQHQEEEQVRREIRLRSVRGYVNKYKKVIKILKRLNLDRNHVEGDTLLIGLKGTGRTPLDYNSKFNVTLVPENSGSHAAKILFRNLLVSMQRNEKGLIDDIDTEFLHDFRVAIRRTRSALTLFKGVLDSDARSYFADKFRSFGHLTGPGRDLDVYLLKEASYRSCLPDRLHVGLDHFFQDLAFQREQEQKNLVRTLRSSSYKEFISEWEEYLESDDQQGGMNIGELASRIILKRYKRILRDGSVIDPETPDGQLHRLRIQGKKLRYALEFFTSLYPKKKMVLLIRQLKNLQNNLGDFNDLSVQYTMLSEYLDRIKTGSKKSREMAGSVGGLLTFITHEQHEVRTNFEETFSRFTKKKNRQMYHRLFDK